MKRLTRTLVVVLSLGFCALGWISMLHEPGEYASDLPRFGTVDPEAGYEFASSNLHKFNFAQLEAIVRADVAAKFPNTRVELGLVKPVRHGLTMNVGLFEPNGECRLYIYTLVSDKNSWKVARAQRLWFVPRSQIARGLRV